MNFLCKNFRKVDFHAIFEDEMKRNKFFFNSVVHENVT